MIRHKIFSHAPLAAIFMLALSLRITGFHFGLPVTVFADEPHHINIAMAFGSGNFDPYIFKYPTLWMYTLFLAFGGVFLGWSGFGLLRSVQDFAHLFVWDPTLVYATARVLTAVVGAAAVIPLFRCAEMIYRSRAPAVLAALLYAVSPPLVFYAHQAKADSLMILLSAFAWMFAAAYALHGRTRHAVLAGVFSGLAASTQYTAILVVPLLVLAHFVRRQNAQTTVERPAVRPLLLGLAAIPAAFFIGSPYTLLRFRVFWGDLMDIQSYGQGELASEAGRLGWGVINHFFHAFGSIPIGAAVIFFSLMALALYHRRLAGYLLLPLVWGGIILGWQSEQAGVINYAFCLFPGLFLMAGAFSVFLNKTLKHAFIQPLLAGILVALPLFETLKINRDFLVEDTRITAGAWVESNIPAGAKILLDQPHTGSALVPSRSLLERLISNAPAGNHPRKRYFQLMLDSHPGGGYEIIRIDRTDSELITPVKRHNEWSRVAHEWLDVENGMKSLTEEKVEWVILSSIGATPQNSPRLNRFFEDLNRDAEQVADFNPAGMFSPHLWIYKIPAATIEKK